MKHAWKTLKGDTNVFGKPEEKKPLERITFIYIYIYIYKRIILKIYMKAGRCDDIDWIYLANDRSIVVNMVIN